MGKRRGRGWRAFSGMLHGYPHMGTTFRDQHPHGAGSRGTKAFLAMGPPTDRHTDQRRLEGDPGVLGWKRHQTEMPN